jgi:hypothetical protein
MFSQRRTRCGRSSGSARIRPHCEAEMPVSASWPAINAQVHTETPSGGAEVAAATIRNRAFGPYTPGRPLRGRSHVAGMPPRTNRRRQVRTVPTTQPSPAAICTSGRPA